MIILTLKSDVMIKGKYKQLCLHRQYSGICAISYTQTKKGTMFYNSKKLIDEKVLQQYYFEKFMLSSAKERKQFLPEKFHDYSSTNSVKGLNPEIKVGEKTDGGSHITDFVLYPMPKKKLANLNIELKWNVQDFIKQSERFPHYNGQISDGFVVALKTDDECPEYLDNDKIPVVYLDSDDFKKWFTKKSYSIVSQALSTKLKIKPSRLSGEKIWVITIVNNSLKHYVNHGKTRDIWAFRDNNNPKHIMNILDGDYVIFLHYKTCSPGRCAYPYSDNPNKQFPKSRGGYTLSSEVNWSIDLIDIREIDKGYHLNYSEKSPYNGFDEEWMTNDNRTPESKNYTQYITFLNEGGSFQYLWDKPINHTLDRELFNEKDTGLAEFIGASRSSMNTRGDAIEISRLAFESILNLLNE